MIIALWACIGLAVFAFFAVNIFWYLQSLHEDLKHIIELLEDHKDTKWNTGGEFFEGEE